MIDQRGPLLAIGGAEDKLYDRLILRRFVELSGGNDADISIIPTASGFPEAASRYENIFRELGARSASVLNVRTREDGNCPATAAEIRESGGIFLTGGNQIRIAATLGGTRVAEALVDANRGGAVVAGTSAGASVMCAVMVAGGRGGRTPRANLAAMSPGLALIDSVVIDQHFRERDRVARLVTMVSYNPGLIGLGIDEDTAALIWPDETMDVIGAGTVLVVDGSEMTSNVASKREGMPITITNAVIHFLTSGSTFNFESRTAIPAKK